MVEREHRASVGTFYAPGSWGASVALSPEAVHHTRVRRLVAGDGVRLTSGDGRRAVGTIAALGKAECLVAVDASTLETLEPPPQIELIVPIGDRDRMLLLAEKAVELGVSSWRPVMFARSRSVSPRGEGDGFHAKVKARQVSALEQSGSAWLPSIHPEQRFSDLLAAEGMRILLDADGERIADALPSLALPISIAAGPEGGLEEAERDALIRAGWRPVSLGGNVLRFETAVIAALAIVRSRFA